MKEAKDYAIMGLGEYEELKPYSPPQIWVNRKGYATGRMGIDIHTNNMSEGMNVEVQNSWQKR